MAWEENETALSLCDSDTHKSQQKLVAKQRLKQIAIKLRVAISQQQIKARYFAMLNGLELSQYNLTEQSLAEYWDAPEELQLALNKPQTTESGILSFTADLVSYLKVLHQQYNEYQSFVEKIEETNDVTQLLIPYQNLLWSWFEKKLVVVENYHATGNDVINEIAQSTPPGLKARIMGMQNIKGTGLDYVYRWQAWENCAAACSQMLDADESIANIGVKQLAQFKEFGPLCEHKVKKVVASVKQKNWTQKEAIQAELVLIESNLAIAMQAENSRQKGSSDSTVLGKGLTTKLAEYVEAFLDAGDAVKRRKKANQIYQDLANKRISHQRASVELQIINKRQKGGWAGEYMSQFRNENN